MKIRIMDGSDFGLGRDHDTETDGPVIFPTTACAPVMPPFQVWNTGATQTFTWREVTP